MVLIVEPAKILIVEDQPAFAKGLRALLMAEAPQGTQDIRIAGSAAEALVISDEFGPQLILMDIGLPGTDGIQATADFKELFPLAVVVMLTASDDEDHLLRALKAGASGYLLKTMDLDELAEAVEAILKGKLVIPAHLVPGITAALRESETAPGKLTKSEETALGLIGQGLSNDRIGESMGVSAEDVGKIISSIYSKLHISTRAEAAAEAARRGLS